MLVVGQGALARKDGAAVLAAARRLAESAGMIKAYWNGFNVLHTAAARVGGLELGFVPGEGGRDLEGILAGAESGAITLVYLLGADEIDMKRFGSAFVVYQGHHGDAGANRADVILPGAAYTEKAATYVNTECRAQRTKLAVFPPGDAREDWAIIRALSDAVGKTLPHDTVASVRAAMVKTSPVFGAIDRVVPAQWAAFGADGAMDAAPFKSPIANFYMTDPISRASHIMAQCTRMRRDLAAAETARTGTGS
jgi:NADH-quinone oxidoreductase subunit G